MNSIIYSDGSALLSENAAGIAFLICSEKRQHELYSCSIFGISSARAELLAALTALSTSQSERITLYSDSNYVVLGINSWLRGWVKRGFRRSNNHVVKNCDLWIRMNELLKNKQITAIKVRAHQNHPLNEIVDREARKVAQKFASQLKQASSRS